MVKGRRVVEDSGKLGMFGRLGILGKPAKLENWKKKVWETWTWSLFHWIRYIFVGVLGAIALDLS